MLLHESYLFWAEIIYNEIRLLRAWSLACCLSARTRLADTALGWRSSYWLAYVFKHIVVRISAISTNQTCISAIKLSLKFDVGPHNKHPVTADSMVHDGAGARADHVRAAAPLDSTLSKYPKRTRDSTQRLSLDAEHEASTTACAL